ncbi:serine/threonine-protein kinase [Kitasatospora sp. NPDC058406]|uniref:serine/threonine-protein kinase n=1 Tax=Kitasatospora sp. NPDC058406 TaxID=3346483 RepID=UPI0036662A97
MIGEPGRAVGDVVAGRFELRQRLGSGAMGTVWRARDSVLERDIALKEMRPVQREDAARSAHMRQRAIREAKALARLNHPNAVTIHEIVDDLPYPWLVMEFVDSVPLDVLLREGTLAPAHAASIGLDILGALRAAHAAGVLHRDVKPANVLIRPDGGAVLTDFGIAALQGSLDLTATGDLIGSPDYLAPERISPEAVKVGPASDLWSLGVLLYICVEGANPMRRDSVWETLIAIREEPLPDLHRAGPLGPLIWTLLSKDPAARPNSEEVARALAAIGEGQPYRPGRDGCGASPPEVAVNADGPVLLSLNVAAVTTVARKPHRKRAPGLVRIGVPIAVGALVLVGVLVLDSARRGALAGAPGGATPSAESPSAAAGGAGTSSAPASVPTTTATVTVTASVTPRISTPATAAPKPAAAKPASPAAVTPVAVAPAPTALPSAAAAPPGAVPPAGAPSAAGMWIAQLGVFPRTVPNDRRDRQLLAVQEYVPDAKILNSDDWSSLQPGNWVIYLGGTFPDGNAVATFCAKLGASDCFGRYLSQNAADSRYICLPRDSSRGAGRDSEYCQRP